MFTLKNTNVIIEHVLICDITVTPVVQFPHNVSTVLEVSALSTVNNEPVVSLQLDPDLPEDASMGPTPSTSQAHESSQEPITDPDSVKSVLTKPKGHAAKKRKRLEKLDSNTAQKYVDMEEDNEPVSSTCNFPTYLLKPPPTTLGVKDLRKHGLITKIEKNQALARLANKLSAAMPMILNILKQHDNSERRNQNADHAYQAPGTS